MTYQDAIVQVLVLVGTKAHLDLDVDDLPWSGDGRGDSRVVSRCRHDVCLSKQG